MTSKNTENHGFEIPQDGYETTDPSYADLLEGSFDEVDARLEMRGPLSERPSAPPGGTKFIVDDPGSDHDGKRFIYRTSAGSWEHRPGNFSAISTGTQSVTGETLVNVRNDSDQSLSASTWETVVYDDENIDQINEYDNSTGVLNLDTDSQYVVSATIYVDGLSSGNTVRVRLRDVSLSATIMETERKASGVSDNLNIVGVAGLNQNSDYEIQVNSVDNTATLPASIPKTRLAIFEAPQA